MTRAVLRLALLALAALIARPAAATDIWFAPPELRPDVADRLRAHPDENPFLLRQLDRAQADWDRLDAPGAAAGLVPPARGVTVTTGFVESLPSAQALHDHLQPLIARGALIGLVAQPVLIRRQDCGHTEGYQDPDVLTAALARLASAHITLSRLELDEGLWFGHYATGAQECHLSLDETMQGVAGTINMVRHAYPGIEVGEILVNTPFTDEPDWQATLRAYYAGIARLTGKAFDFFSLDISWENPSWRQSLVAETLLVRQLGARMDYIYNGSLNDPSDTAWIDDARTHIAEIEGGLGITPDAVGFASWNTHPTHLIGSPPAPTLQALMLDYARPGARIHQADTDTQLAGIVTDLSGTPLPGYRVALDAVPAPAEPQAPLPVQTLTGHVPAAARAVSIAVLLNSDCLCAGIDDVSFGDPFVYAEAGAGTRRDAVSFMHHFRHIAAQPTPADPAAQVIPASPTASETQPAPDAPDTAVAHLLAGPHQKLILYSDHLPVTPGADFTLTVPVRNRRVTDLYGSVALLWLDDKGGIFDRAVLFIRPDFHPAGSAVTDAQGRFAFPRPRSAAGAPLPARLTVPDQQGHRAAIALIQP